ncbi:MAG: ethanolamine ammonia-lyase subunit EutB [Proteobacteria bacterium]|nr:ethanolamine ammonia-lyase subunit EutB [Pseudomonadota bacterium]
MAAYRTTLSHRNYVFQNLGDVLAKASPLRSGDVLAGVAAQSEEERVASQLALSEIPLKDFLKSPLIPYENDEVTRILYDSWDEEAFHTISHLTVGEFREFLLDQKTNHDTIRKISPGLIPEMVAGVSKLMRNQDLISVARKVEVITKFRSTVGKKGHLSVRLQPNHPTDDLKAIMAVILDGLSYGCGDAVIGINPATDSLERMTELQKLLSHLIESLSIPTQSCVLGHVTHQIKAIEGGSPVDLVFQSIAGTQLTNESFGVNAQILQEAQEAALSLKRGEREVMYFETGQGSCLSAQGHWRIDQQTLEARAYGFARVFHPFLINSVVGFIGPEYLYDSKQIIRAGLEDHFCGKLLGLPMGCDVCYTNHAEADQDDMDNLLTLLGVAGCNYFMGVPGADDIMLNYQSTSFHDACYVRDALGLKPSPEFELWLEKMKSENNGLLKAASRLLPKGSP